MSNICQRPNLQCTLNICILTLDNDGDILFLEIFHKFLDGQIIFMDPRNVLRAREQLQCGIFLVQFPIAPLVQLWLLEMYLNLRPISLFGVLDCRPGILAHFLLLKPGRCEAESRGPLLASQGRQLV